MVIVDVQIVIARMSLIARDVVLQGGRDTTAAVAEGIPSLLSASVASFLSFYEAKFSQPPDNSLLIHPGKLEPGCRLLRLLALEKRRNSGIPRDDSVCLLCRDK